MRRKVAEIVKERDSGEVVISVLHYSDIAADSVSPEVISNIKDRGACVIRSTFASEQARAWDDEIATYVEENGLNEKLANAAEDNYFATLAAAKPQIYGMYWSRPQVEARQSESLARCAGFSTGCGWLRARAAATSIQIKFRCMRTGSGGALQDPVHSGFHRMWTAARSSAACSRISGMCSPCFLDTGMNTIHST